jgi:hypothetical protein
MYVRSHFGSSKMSMRPPLLRPGAAESMTVGAAPSRALGIYAKGKNKGNAVYAVYAKGKNKGKGFQERIDGAGTLRPRGTVGQGKGERELNQSVARLREAVDKFKESVGQAGKNKVESKRMPCNSFKRLRGKGFQDKADSDSSSSIVYIGDSDSSSSKGGSQNPYSSTRAYKGLLKGLVKGLVKGNNTGEAGKGKEIKGKHMGGKGERSRSPPWRVRA